MKTITSMIVLLVAAWAGSAHADPPATQHAATTRPAEGRKRLEIKATIDGSDQLHITPDGLTWVHKLWEWPSDVQINGQACDPHDTIPLEQLGIESIKDDLCAERVTVVDRDARDTLAVEADDKGIIVYFADSPGGADTYSVTLEFGAATQSTQSTKGPTTRP